MQCNILSYIKRFESHETIRELFRQMPLGAVKLSIIDKVRDVILDIVAIIANLFSAIDEEIIKNSVYNNENISRFLKYSNLGKLHKIICES